MKHLAAPVPSATHVSHSRTSDFVTGSYHPRSSIQMMRDEMTSKLPDLPPPALPPKYAPTFGMDNPFSSANKSCSNYLTHLNLCSSRIRTPYGALADGHCTGTRDP